MTAGVEAVTAPGLLTLLREDVRCVFQRDPAARSTFEVITTYPGVHAILMQRIAHRLWRVGLRYDRLDPGTRDAAINRRMSRGSLVYRTSPRVAATIAT